MSRIGSLAQPELEEPEYKNCSLDHAKVQSCSILAPEQNGTFSNEFKLPEGKTSVLEISWSVPLAPHHCQNLCLSGPKLLTDIETAHSVGHTVNCKI